MKKREHDWVDWVLGVIGAMLVVAVGSLYARVDSHETRISKTEAAYDEGTKPSLARIESKVDKVLEYIIEKPVLTVEKRVP